MSIEEPITGTITKPIQRFASLDFQRGLAIWLMTFLHAAANIYNSKYIEEDITNVLDLPAGVLVLMAFLGFFAVWNSYFLLISATVNSIAMSKRISAGHEPEGVLFKQLLTGVGLLIVNMIDNSFLYSGYFGESIKTGNWTNTYPLWDGFFEMGTLRIIAWSLIINGIILYFLLKNNGHEKYRRNLIVFGSLAIVIIVVSPFIHTWVDSMPWEIPATIPSGVDLGDNPSWPSLDFQALNANFKSWFFVILAGDFEPLFPYLATSFIGALIGLTLARPKPVKRLPLIGGLSGVGAMGLGGIFLAVGMYSFDNQRPPLGNYFLMLGAQICSMFLLLWLVEYRGKSQKFGNNVVIKHFRRWGMISLTIYTLQIFELLPRWVFGSFYNLILKTNINVIGGSIFGIGEEYKTIIFAIFAMLFFELLVFLWSKLNFIFTFEWVIVRLNSIGIKERSKRLDVDVMMNQITWIDLKNKFSTIDSSNI